MVWLLGTLAGMGKGAANATKKSLEFAVDIGEEIIGIDDEYDGVWGTVWGSWEDNVLGAAGEEGVVQHLFGEEGVGGRFFGAIPEAVRSPARNVITPTFEAMDWAYDNLVDRNLGTLITIGQQSVANTLDVLAGKADTSEIFTLFNPDEWRQAYHITESRSAGQALAMASQWIDLDDAAEVERFKGTAYYKMVSGAADAFGNIVLDPANVLFGAGKVGKLSQMARNTAKKKIGIGYQNVDAAINNSKSFQKFENAIEALRYTEDLKWSENYKKGSGFTDSDLDNIDILTSRIMKDAQSGKLGSGQKNMGVDQARALASLPNKAARDAYFKLAVTGGDMSVMEEMSQAARKHHLAHQEGGLHHQLSEVNQRLEAGEFGADATSRKFLEHEQKRLEKKLMEENPELPFGAALSMKEERLHALASRADLDRGYVTPDELNSRYDALNDDPHLVNAATDQILIHNHVDTMDSLPKIGAFNEAGIAVKTFVEKAPLLGAVASTRVVRAIVEKVPQGMILWDDVDQSFSTFQRMLRDAEKIGIDKIDDLFVDQKLGAWTNTNDTNALKELFESTVNEINGRMVDHFGQRMEGVNKKQLTQILQRQWKEGDSALKAKAKNARVYGQKGIRITDAVEGGETVARYMPVTTAQLEAAALVPRYDLYRQAFTDKSMFAKNMGQAKSVTVGAVNAFTSVWKKSVLLRPAWPMRVLIDEYARSAAHLGTLDTLKSVMGGMGDLRANWFRKNGEDLGPLIQKGMLDELGYSTQDAAREKRIWGMGKGVEELEQFLKGGARDNFHPNTLKRIKEANGDPALIRNEIDTLKMRRAKLLDENQPINYYELVEEYVEKFGDDAAQSLVQKTIYDEYGKKKIRRRTLGAAAAAGVVAGPAGLAIGALYGVMARGSLKRLAKMETGSAIGLQLRSVARTQLRDEVSAIRRSVENVTDPDELAAAAKEIEDITRAADMLEAQAKNLNDQQLLQYDALTERNAELYDNFDRAGRLLHDAGLGNAHIGGIGYANHFGNDAQEIAIYRSAISADNSNRALWDSASDAKRRATQLREPIQYRYDDNPEKFTGAYNDTVNRQYVPSTDPTVNNAYQDFQRLMWEDTPHDEIVRWLKSEEGAVLQDAMPHYFGDVDKLDPDDLLIGFRREVNALVPNHPDFADVRKQIIEGREVNWNRDIQPIIDRKYGGDIEKVRNQTGEFDFGNVIGDSSFKDAADSHRLLVRVQEKLDNIFQNIGTMPTDVLTRSLVFRNGYTREMTRRLARYEDSGKFRLTESQIKQMERQSRTVAIKETRNLLYDLAERSKFEEIVANVMPFYGAWQEVITRWTGLAARNPAFVAAGARNFRKGIETMDGTDENGVPVFVLSLPEGLMNMEIPGLGIKAFGRMSALGENAIDFNFGSASMISAGLPGFGPLVSIATSETVLKVPELAESLDLLLPYGPTEGQSFLERVIKNVQPTWTKTAASAQFNTAQRQRVKARITADLAAEYAENGEVIDNEAEWAEFEAEIDRRATNILTVRMLGNLGLPINFVAQSPHYAIIHGYKEVTKNKGLEAADEWLLSKHPEMFAVLGRQTRVRTVASATLEGEKLYQQTKEFADNNSEIGDFIVGKVGSLDSGFEYNRAVQIKEINEGRRVRLDPREIYTRAAEQKGWAEFRDQMAVIDNELVRRGSNGLSVHMNAKTNEDLREMKQKIVTEIATINPQWKHELDEFESAEERAVAIHSFRKVADSPLFEDRVEIDKIRDYIDMRDKIAVELERRQSSTGDMDRGLLSHDDNEDLDELWTRFRLQIATESDFAPIFHRYFNNDTSISKLSWPSSYMVTREEQEIGKLTA